MICISKFECCAQDKQNRRKRVKSLKLLPERSDLKYESQISGSVSTPNWSFHSSNHLKSSNQLLNDPNITECRVQLNREYDL